MRTNFWVGVDTMRILDRLFTFACEECKNGAIALAGLLASDSGVDGVLTKAAEGMVSEVGCGRFVLRVLKAADTTRMHLALASSTGKEMTRSTIVVLESNVGFEE
jgi:hypothetical protein